MKHPQSVSQRTFENSEEGFVLKAAVTKLASGQAGEACAASSAMEVRSRWERGSDGTDVAFVWRCKL